MVFLLLNMSRWELTNLNPRKTGLMQNVRFILTIKLELSFSLLFVQPSSALHTVFNRFIVTEKEIDFLTPQSRHL